jgi:hypothetical protein
MSPWRRSIRVSGPIGSLVDLGTGTGRMLGLLAPRAAKATGLDANLERAHPVPLRGQPGEERLGGVGALGPHRLEPGPVRGRPDRQPRRSRHRHRADARAAGAAGREGDRAGPSGTWSERTRSHCGASRAKNVWAASARWARTAWSRQPRRSRHRHRADARAAGAAGREGDRAGRQPRHAVDGGLRHVERAHPVPLRGQPGEERLGGVGALGPQAGGAPPRGRLGVLPPARGRGGPGRAAHRRPRRHDQELEVAGDPRLRLAQDVGEVRDRQFAVAEQHQDVLPPARGRGGPGRAAHRRPRRHGAAALRGPGPAPGGGRSAAATGPGCR